MICKKCQFEVPEDAKICPNCGEEIVLETEEASTEENVNNQEVAEEMPAVSTEKQKKTLKVVLAAVLVVVIAAAAFIGISQLFNSNGKFDDHAVVYTVTKNEVVSVFVGTEKGEKQLVRKLVGEESFTEGSEFAVKGDNLYFLDDESGLSVMNINNGKVKKIGDDFMPGTLSFSHDAKTVLYVGEDTMLYKSVNGKKAKQINYLNNKSFENQLPAYGFINETNKVWYGVIDEVTMQASLYNEAGDALVSDAVSSVFHVADNGKVVVYSTVTDTKTITPEPATTEEGEEAQPQEPIVEKTYALKVSDNGNVKVLSDNYISSDTVLVANTDKKGVYYIADKTEAVVDEETGNIVAMASGKLFFYEFGGNTTEIDDGVTVALFLDEINGSNYYYDAADRAEDETVVYMKDNSLKMFKDFKIIENPEEFEFLMSSPVFGNNNSVMVYKTYIPTEEEPIDETTDEAAEDLDKDVEEVQVSKLVYTMVVDGKWIKPVEIVESPLSYIYDEKNDAVYYTLANKDKENVFDLYKYTVKEAKSVLISENVIAGYETVSKEDGLLYYINNFDEETKFAVINSYNGKKSEVVLKEVVGMVTSQTGVPFVVYNMRTTEDVTRQDIYTVKDGKVIKMCEQIENIIFAR